MADSTTLEGRRASSFNANKQRVCSSHWDGLDSGCGKCPIRLACHSGPTTRLTYDDLMSWRDRVNAAADDVAIKEAAWP